MGRPVCCVCPAFLQESCIPFGSFFSTTIQCLRLVQPVETVGSHNPNPKLLDPSRPYYIRSPWPALWAVLPVSSPDIPPPSRVENTSTIAGAIPVGVQKQWSTSVW
jgi:hypothetical protein